MSRFTTGLSPLTKYRAPRQQDAERDGLIRLIVRWCLLSRYKQVC